MMATTFELDSDSWPLAPAKTLHATDKAAQQIANIVQEARKERARFTDTILLHREDAIAPGAQNILSQIGFRKK